MFNTCLHFVQIFHYFLSQKPSYLCCFIIVYNHFYSFVYILHNFECFFWSLLIKMVECFSLAKRENRSIFLSNCFSLFAFPSFHFSFDKSRLFIFVEFSQWCLSSVIGNFLNHCYLVIRRAFFLKWFFQFVIDRRASIIHHRSSFIDRRYWTFTVISDASIINCNNNLVRVQLKKKKTFNKYLPKHSKWVVFSTSLFFLRLCKYPIGNWLGKCWSKDEPLLIFFASFFFCVLLFHYLGINK